MWELSKNINNEEEDAAAAAKGKKQGAMKVTKANW
jgi:hypothetical protein